eukprot:CAMPEP_0114311284 /NCGR_PEP_ID=MMETSP0059-20121206/19736_1 /TAXON_ID=36894 /ORGANISM="Pyramimonas parkeae, Strain CCMP726" /LENGTH=38 /DNA_ID= /DNA_START= /DNA_END= /DNA_ORIENTATION=
MTICGVTIEIFMWQKYNSFFPRLDFMLQERRQANKCRK